MDSASRIFIFLFLDDLHIDRCLAALCNPNGHTSIFKTAHELWILPCAGLNTVPCKQFVVSRRHVLEFESAGGIARRKHLIDVKSKSAVVNQNDSCRAHELLSIVHHTSLDRSWIRAENDTQRF